MFKIILISIWGIIADLAFYAYLSSGLSVTDVVERFKGIIQKSGVWGACDLCQRLLLQVPCFFPCKHPDDHCMNSIRTVVRHFAYLDR